MAVYQVDALVIRSREFGEADRLTTLFSRELGKIEAVAKGARKPKSRQRAGVQLFTYADYLIYRGRNLDTINQAGAKESFPHLWADLEQTMAASGMTELLEHATLVGQPHEELFTLTLTCFYLLKHFPPPLLLAGYALRLTAVLGFTPSLEQCAGCGGQVSGERYLFDVEAGGIVCPACQTGRAGRVVLKAGSVAMMRQLLKGDLRKLDRLRCPGWMLLEILETVRLFCENQFGRPLKSWKMRSLLGGEE
ncbi:MAG: DNA repair protein RecO [Peptococcaceae bacterium]|nr:DNA repair protein RecO [Peptococcaceae bacterium]